jgi:hypothetical protein
MGIQDVQRRVRGDTVGWRLKVQHIPGPGRYRCTFLPYFLFFFFYGRHPATIKQLHNVIIKRDGNTGSVFYISVPPFSV